MDVDEYAEPFKYFVYRATDKKCRQMYFVYVSAKSHRLPDPDDPDCLWRGDNFDEGRRIAQAKNTELERMRKKQTLDLNL